ncbi:MAG: valine--tRNA ligase [Hyphomicrobiales bacterium]|nr:valine--tRNA ligase [Hyphomicrobiales bacterium]
MEKSFEPAQIESTWYARWEASGAFQPTGQGEPYCILLPPPNVTGTLHMGHAFQQTVMDMLVRYQRMRGMRTLWQVGTDHAGIATQKIVENQLALEHKTRHDLGREAFIERVWQWKEESGSTITHQMRRIGAAADWSRERFTMDEGLSRAVLKVFVELYREGLIYKDKRLVNWDPKLKTAISDLEVQQVETKGHLWYIKYPIEGSDDFVVVATTRPETMLGDVAVAIHPDNERLKHVIGKHAVLPLVGRRIPIIADAYADPEKGSGAVKITPAHDFNDFEVGKRHNLPLINVFDEDAHLAIQGNEAFLKDAKPDPAMLEVLEGKPREAARKLVVEWLESRGLVEKIEPTQHVVPHGDRSGAVLEPFLTDQWYVDAKTLAQPAIAAVRDGRTKFVPQQWQATFFNWLENIQPWCISRQIWWGHQIPAWYGPDGKVFVAESEDDVIADALAHYTDIEEITAEEGHDIAADPVRRARFAGEYLHRDEDVLDTWFSSALWPFSTLGWPDRTPELERYYPNTALVTGFDIIFFWVARMMMMGLHFMKEVPFHEVYIHALVRDATGAKMSKSKGNVIDPLHLIDKFGADALRFTLAAMAAQGRDIKLSEQRVEGYRNFATKLWNAARFAEMNGCASVPGFDPRNARETLNRWIAHETAKAAAEVTESITSYKFNEAAGAIYRFVWNIYCDWYLELAKPVLTGADGSAKDETRAMVAWARDEILQLLHPFMPFITEDLWSVTASLPRPSLLALGEWRSLEGMSDPKAEAEIGWVIDLVSAVRSVRAEMNVNAPLPLVMVRAGDHVWERVQRWSEFIKRMARISEVTRAPTYPQGAMQLVIRGEVVALPLAGVIDLAAEQARLAKEMAKADADIARVDAKLGNPNFVARAPEEIIEEEKDKREEAQLRKSKLAEALERLKGAA